MASTAGRQEMDVSEPDGRTPPGDTQRIQGELLKLGHQVSASSIRRILKQLKIPPTPQRNTDTTWRQFLRTQATTMLGCDFFHVECAVTLQRLYCFVVIEVSSRQVHILGVTANPDGPWTTQQIWNLLMDLGDRASRFRFLIGDRAGQFTASFDTVLQDAGDRSCEDPPAQPSRERFLGTVCPHRPSRVHRPDADLRPAAHEHGPGRVRPALPRAKTTLRPRAEPASP
jgi:hypothetical protein